jgi:hypothetical protein
MENKNDIIDIDSIDIDSEPEVSIAKTEPQAIQVSPDAPPLVQIAQLLASGVKIDVEAMKAMQEMGERAEANTARKAFAFDFTIAQANIESVVKTKINPQTRSKYAGLENVIELAKPVYTAQGFSVIFYEGDTEAEESIRVCADVLHRDGHEKKYFYDVPLDGKGIKGNVNMTRIHGKASSVSYGRRYLMCMIWNIPTPDDDGNAAGKKPDPKPERPAPNEAEQAVLTAVFEGLFDFANDKERVIDAGLLAKWSYEEGLHKNKYMTTQRQ